MNNKGKFRATFKIQNPTYENQNDHTLTPRAISNQPDPIYKKAKHYIPGTAAGGSRATVKRLPSHRVKHCKQQRTQTQTSREFENTSQGRKRSQTQQKNKTIWVAAALPPTLSPLKTWPWCAERSWPCPFSSYHPHVVGLLRNFWVALSHSHNCCGSVGSCADATIQPTHSIVMDCKLTWNLVSYNVAFL